MYLQWLLSRLGTDYGMMGSGEGHIGEKTAFIGVAGNPAFAAISPAQI